MGIHVFKYHDKDYDGIVLKINSGWLATNPEFNEVLEEFRMKMAECAFSSMMPDHTRNLSELTNWREKSADIRQEKKDREESRDREIRRRRKLLNAEILEIEYREHVLYQFNDDCSIEIDGKVWEHRDQVTRMSGVSAKFKRAFEDKLATIDTWEEFKKFIQDSGFISPPTYAPSSMINWKGGKMISTGVWKSPTVKIKIPYLKIYEETKRSNDLVYRNFQLEYDEDMGYFLQGRVIDKIHSERMTFKGMTATFTKLDRYTLENGRFIKKEE